MNREELFMVVSDLAQAIQGSLAYPENHPKVDRLLLRLHQQVQAQARRADGLTFGFFNDHVVVDECPFVGLNSTLERLSARMRDIGIEKIRIDEGITFGEMKRFVRFLGDGNLSPDARKWESIVYGKVEGTIPGAGPLLELSSSPPSGLLASAADALRDILVSLASEGSRSKVAEGRDIVSSIILALREESDLIGRLIRLQGHDDYTVTHSLNVCIITVAQAVHLGLPEGHVREIGLAALLHDIGKETVRGEILNKPGRLEMEEFDKVKEHPLAGAKLLRKIDCGTELPMIVAFEHHVKYDFSGYPKRRSTAPLHTASYMAQIADVYDALRGFRPYKPAMELSKTISVMKQGRGTEFEPRLFDSFLEIISCSKGRKLDRNSDQ